MRVARATGWVVFVLAPALAADKAGPVPAKDPTAAEDKPAVKEFLDSVGRYEAIRKEALNKLPKLKPTSDPGRIRAHQRALAEEIRKARAGARQGDIFKPEAAGYFRRVIASEMRGNQGRSARQTIEEDTGGVAVNLEANGDYPADQPLSAVPPALLLRLPKPSRGLDYRFVGRSLILRDSDAAMVVDFLPDAVPPR